MTKKPTKINSVPSCPFNTDITCERSLLLKKYKEEIDNKKLWHKVISFRGSGGKYPLLSCCNDCTYCPTKQFTIDFEALDIKELKV